MRDKKNPGAFYFAPPPKTQDASRSKSGAGAGVSACSLDTRCFCNLLEAGFLAASPRAAILADPCVFSRAERLPMQMFAFSDIPDMRFRKPRDIFHLSQRYVSGGIKS